MAERFPVYYDAGGLTPSHRPMEEGDKIPVSLVPISADTTNQLQAIEDGLYVPEVAVDIRALISTALGNTLTVEGDGLYVPDPMSPSSALSKQDGNYIRLGDDGGVFLDGNDILSNGRPNALVIDPTDGKIYLPPDAVGAAISTDDGQLLVVGKDGGILLKADGLTDDLISAQLPNALKLGNDGKLFVEQVEVVTGATVVDNPDGYPAGSYLALTIRLTNGGSKVVYADLSRLIDVYTAGEGVSIIDRVVSLNLTTGGGLTFDEDGSLKVDSEAISPSSFVSKQEGNSLSVGSDGGLYVEAVKPSELMSKDTGNALSFGADGGLFAPQPVSKDTGNSLAAGTDGGAYLPLDFGILI